MEMGSSIFQLLPFVVQIRELQDTISFIPAAFSPNSVKSSGLPRLPEIFSGHPDYLRAVR